VAVEEEEEEEEGVARRPLAADSSQSNAVLLLQPSPLQSHGASEERPRTSVRASAKAWTWIATQPS